MGKMMKKKGKDYIWSKNSNIVNIALNYSKKEQRRENARRVAPVTLLCNKKKNDKKNKKQTPI